MSESVPVSEASPGRVECLLCPHHCRLAPYERGICRVRVNVDGRLFSLAYGRPCAVHVDPIEKKPMYHVLPGSRAFSLATAGCCLSCRYCQNWSISQADPDQVSSVAMTPQAVVDAAVNAGCASVAYTYNEPTVFFEYARDIAVLARERGLLNINVTSGYIEADPCRCLSALMDGANVDLKGFTEEFYRDVCGGSLKPVLDALVIMREAGTFVEVTNLVVPGYNDDPAVFRRMADWLVANLGASTPLHLSRFQPQYRLANLSATPTATLVRLAEVAREAGLHHVYVGNVFVPGSSATRCHACGGVVVDRVGFLVTQSRVRDGACPDCGEAVPGIWRPRRPQGGAFHGN